jgi:hypothetical protein
VPSCAARRSPPVLIRVLFYKRKMYVEYTVCIVFHSPARTRWVPLEHKGSELEIVGKGCNVGVSSFMTRPLSRFRGYLCVGLSDIKDPSFTEVLSFSHLTICS